MTKLPAPQTSTAVRGQYVLSAAAFVASAFCLGWASAQATSLQRLSASSSAVLAGLAIVCFATLMYRSRRDYRTLSHENRALRALHGSELESHKQALSGFSAVCVLDADHRVIEANPQFTELVSSTNSIATTPLARALPALTKTPLWQALRAQELWTGDVELELDGADRRVYLATALPQLSPDGDFLRTLLIMFDRTEEKGGAVDNMLHATLEHLNEDVYVYDVDTLELRYMNQEARLRCNWSTAEVRKMKITDTVPKFDLNLFRKHSNPVMLGEKESATIQVMHEKGPVEIVTRMIVGMDNKRLFVSTLRELSERHEIEKARMQSVSMISHELRTPLTSIKGALSLLNSGALGTLPRQAQQVINIANRNSDRLLNVINDILDYEKLASGNMNFSDEKVDLRALINEALENMKSYAEINDVSLVPDLPDQDAFTFGDGDRLMQVLVNLMSNAAKFSPSDAEVLIRLGSVTTGWRISVRDQGPGFPQSMLSQIGKPFMQFEGTREKKHLGTGLGLTIVKRILLHHNAKLLVSTREGKGSEFAFELCDYAAHLAERDKNLVAFDPSRKGEKYGT